MIRVRPQEKALPCFLLIERVAASNCYDDRDMSDASKPPPDFAMLRAVEILAQIAEKMMRSASIVPPPLDVPIVLFNENIMFVIGKTQRASVIKALGPGYAYPAKGWESYAMREHNVRYLLSALYRDEILVGVDYYVPNPSSVPELSPRNFGEFRLVPGQIAMGSDMTRLDERFVHVDDGPDARRYAHAFEVRYRGGVAYVQSNGPAIQRMVLYAVDPA
jgi:hypothetical protein